MKKLLMVIPLVLLLCFTFSYQKGEEVAEEPVVDIEAEKEAIITKYKEELRIFDELQKEEDISKIAEAYVSWHPDESKDLYLLENEDVCWKKPKEYGEFLDARDNQKYRTIKIGSQIWMAENLNFIIEGSWWYENKEENGDKYGRLYTWKAAMEACPEGWHLPTDEEWKQLEKHLGMSKAELDLIDYRDSEKQLKTKLQKIGFSLPMAGCRTFKNGDFLGKDEFTFFWSATPYKEIYAWKRAFDIKTEGIGRHSHNKKHANSVRYIKDK